MSVYYESVIVQACVCLPLLVLSVLNEIRISVPDKMCAVGWFMLYSVEVLFLSCIKKTCVCMYVTFV